MDTDDPIVLPAVRDDAITVIPNADAIHNIIGVPSSPPLPPPIHLYYLLKLVRQNHKKDPPVIK
jgi:hypothetical protein